MPASTNGFCPVVRDGLLAQKPNDDSCVVNTRDLFADTSAARFEDLGICYGQGGKRLLLWRHTELGWQQRGGCGPKGSTGTYPCPSLHCAPGASGTAQPRLWLS